jgi:hypothetical protein
MSRALAAARCSNLPRSRDIRLVRSSPFIGESSGGFLGWGIRDSNRELSSDIYLDLARREKYPFNEDKMKKRLEVFSRAIVLALLSLSLCASAIGQSAPESSPSSNA